MGFKVGDKVRDNCLAKICKHRGEDGCIVVYGPYTCRVRFENGDELECNEDHLLLVESDKDKPGKLSASRLDEIMTKKTFEPRYEGERGEGRKDDSGKQRWELLLGDALLPAVKSVLGVLTFGAQKYADDNWLKVPDARRRYYNALLRHLTDWKMGKRYDEDSGLPTLAHAACDALFLLAFDLLDGVLPGGEKK